MKQTDGYFTVPVSSQIAVSSMAGYSVETYYINTTSRTVYIKDRSGVVTEIPPCVAPEAQIYPSGCLVVQQIFRGGRKTIENWSAQLHSTEVNFQSEAMAARGSAQNTTQSFSRYDKMDKTTCYRVGLAGSNVNKIVRYVDDYDIIVIAGADLDFALQQKHPASLIGHVARAVSTPMIESSLYLKILNISSGYDKKDLWTIINGVVRKVPAIEDMSLSDGIYILYPENGTAKFFADGFKDLERANAESAATGLTFFDSEARAKLHLLEDNEATNLLRLQEAQAKKNETDAKLQMSENNLAKAQQEKVTIAQKAFEDEQKHARTIQELEAECNKLKHEAIAKNMETGRKNISDTIKYVPAIIAAVTGLCALLLKKSS